MGLFDAFRKKSRPKPDFSNVRSGSSSTAPSPPPASAGAPGATPDSKPLGAPRTHVVVSGDSLSKIAKRIYGDANQWPKIYEANRDVIKNPDLIHPGQILKIP